jgi:hypothetical protein
MMLGKTRVFKDFLVPHFCTLRSFDGAPVTLFRALPIGALSPSQLFFSRYRTGLTVLLTGLLWAFSVSLSVRLAVGPEPLAKYFNARDSFSVIGCLIALIFVCGSLAVHPSPGSHAEVTALNVSRFGCSLFWMFAALDKIVVWGLLAWSTDLSYARYCGPAPAFVCDSPAQTAASLLVRHFLPQSAAGLRSMRADLDTTAEMWAYNAVVVLMWALALLHGFLVLKADGRVKR